MFDWDNIISTVIGFFTATLCMKAIHVLVENDVRLELLGVSVRSPLQKAKKKRRATAAKKLAA